GSTLSADALEGRLSAYVKIGAGPFSKSWEVTVFGWDGHHESTQLFGVDGSWPLKLATWAAQSKVDPKSLECLPYGHAARGHPECLKDPTKAASLNAAACSSWPASPTLQYINCAPFYSQLRGPTK